MFRDGNGITSLSVKNNSDATVTGLSLLVEFADDTGVTRSAEAFRIIDAPAGEYDEVDTSIDPHSTWRLGSNQFFPLDGVPGKLVKEGKVTIRVMELKTE